MSWKSPPWKARIDRLKSIGEPLALLFNSPAINFIRHRRAGRSNTGRPVYRGPTGLPRPYYFGNRNVTANRPPQSGSPLGVSIQYRAPIWKLIGWWKIGKILPTIRLIGAFQVLVVQS